eukprot:6532891-Prymnesium_polylepis.1
MVPAARRPWSKTPELAGGAREGPQTLRATSPQHRQKNKKKAHKPRPEAKRAAGCSFEELLDR